MSQLLSRIKDEIVGAIPAILFFLIAFNLINFTERLLLKPEEISGFYISYLNASVGALLVGKIIIIMNSFSFILTSAFYNNFKF